MALIKNDLVKLKYMPLGDIHLGHNNNKDIGNNLRQYFIDNEKEISKIDILFFEGDEYDRLLANGSDEANKALEDLIFVIRFCQRYNIKVRCIEGTSSHCYKQMKTLQTTLKEYNIKVDFKYFETISIEYISEYDIHVLYIPDEMNDKTSDTFKTVKELMVKNKISTVDLTIMHGQFHYQLPIKLESSHNEQDYINITKYYVTVNHVHTHSIFKNIIAPGSFDRLAHNEEEDKGTVIVTIYKDDTSAYKFIKNKHAKTFMTITFDTTNLKELERIIADKTKGLRYGSFVRLRSHRGNPIFNNFKEIKKALFKFNVSKDHTDKNKDKTSVINSIIDNNIIDVETIDKNNIVRLVNNELKERNTDINLLPMVNLELQSLISNNTK